MMCRSLPSAAQAGRRTQAGSWWQAGGNTMMRIKLANCLMAVCIDLCADESPMQMFYKDKGIFLTGGTGFFGKSK